MDADAFDDDRDAVLARAREAGVASIVVPATTAARWPALAGLCAGHTELHAAFGLHPMFLREHDEAHLDRLRSEEHTSELQSRGHLVCRLLLEKKKEHEKVILEAAMGALIPVQALNLLGTAV